MKKLTLAIIVALAASLAVAQGPGGKAGGPGGPGGPGGQRGGRMDPKAMLDMFTKTLALKPAQSKQIGTIFAARQAEMEKLRSAPGDRKSKQPQMKKLRDAYTEKVKKVLTKEQAAKYDKMMADMRAKMGGGRGGPGAGGPGGPGGKGGPPKVGGR